MLGGGVKGAGSMLDEHIDPDYQPTDKEVEEYAEWLGMDLDKDRDLFWIARAGLKAPLPAPWKPCESEDGEIFYFNFETGESVWDHPCDEHYRKVYEKYKAKKDGDKAPAGDDKKKDKKDKKDKKARKSGSGDMLGLSGELDMPKMDLPKPGESLFGKPSKNKLVFDCKPKAKAEPSPSPSAPSASPGPSAPGASPSAASATSAASGKTSVFEAQRGKMEADHQESLQRLEREHQEKLRQLHADFERQREEQL
ncbi:unnamed protein product, partial [Effrenium voratum]